MYSVRRISRDPHPHGTSCPWHPTFLAVLEYAPAAGAVWVAAHTPISSGKSWLALPLLDSAGLQLITWQMLADGQLHRQRHGGPSSGGVFCVQAKKQRKCPASLTTSLPLLSKCKDRHQERSRFGGPRIRELRNRGTEEWRFQR